MRNATENYRDNWVTPQWLFDAIEDRWGPFRVDAAASPANSKCDVWLQDGLHDEWGPGRTWCNPPYSQISLWVAKAALESEAGHGSAILVPSCTGTSWWHDYGCHAGVSEIVFLRSKFPFEGAKHNSPFYCSILIFRPVSLRAKTGARATFWDPRPYRPQSKRGQPEG